MLNAKNCLLLASWLIFAISWVNPPWPGEQVLHSVPAALGLVALWYFDRKEPISVWAFGLVCFFIALHNIGAHWLYSNVPYDAWAQAAFGRTLSSVFGWERNHFDRLIHLLFGLCFTPALCELLRRRYVLLSSGQAFVLAVLLIMASSLVYEWIEWGIALTLSPEDAESYNGQQGDIWDAHMDMLLATLGALFWSLKWVFMLAIPNKSERPGL